MPFLWRSVLILLEVSLCSNFPPVPFLHYLYSFANKHWDELWLLSLLISESTENSNMKVFTVIGECPQKTDWQSLTGQNAVIVCLAFLIEQSRAAVVPASSAVRLHKRKSCKCQVIGIKTILQNSICIYLKSLPSCHQWKYHKEWCKSLFRTNKVSELSPNFPSRSNSITLSPLAGESQALQSALTRITIIWLRASPIHKVPIKKQNATHLLNKRPPN